MARQDEAQPVAPQVLPLTTDQFAELVKAIKGGADEDDLLKKRAEYDAQAMRRALHPENEQHPGISVFSHPEGDQKHPKEPLVCEMFWVGYPEMAETLTVEESRLLNLLAAKTQLAGNKSYSVTRTDGSPMKVDVTCEADHTGALRKLEIFFPCRGEAKNNLPSKASMLREMLGELSATEASMREEIVRLRAQLAQAGR